MAAKAKESSHASPPVNQLAGWARQGIESFVAAQKTLLDLTAQQNALVFGMVRERLIKPTFRPDAAIVKLAEEGVERLTAAGKILLDLAAGETALVVDGVKEGLRLPAFARTALDVVRDRVDTLISLQKRLLEAATEQTHTVAESYREGKVGMAGASLAELARQGIESFIETEKKFLDLVAHEVTAATKAGKEGRKHAGGPSKVLAQLAREGVEKYIDAQKQLLHLAMEQMESTGKVTGELLEAARKEARTSFVELTEKSVRNFVTTQKSLMDLAVKPIRASAAAEVRKTPHARPRHKKHPVEAHVAA
jgi:hypothetical protein